MQTRMQAFAESNRNATLLDATRHASEGVAGLQLGPFANWKIRTFDEVLRTNKERFFVCRTRANRGKLH